MVMTTKPCEASRGPSHEMLDCAAVYPGEIATAPNVPSAVDVGYVIVPPPKPLAANRDTVVRGTANGPADASIEATVGAGPRSYGLAATVTGGTAAGASTVSCGSVAACSSMACWLTTGGASTVAGSPAAADADGASVPAARARPRVATS